MVRSRLLAIALATAMLGASGRAEIIESSPMGFGVRHEAVINASADVVYAALTDAIPKWWDPAHTFSHDSRNLSLEPKPGGCLCERLLDGGGVEHLRVIYASPGKLLRLTGAVGPQQEASGTMTWTLSQAGATTKVDLSYVVGGFRAGGFQNLPAIVDGVMRGQLLRLKAYIETGRPDAS